MLGPSRKFHRVVGLFQCSRGWGDGADQLQEIVAWSAKRATEARTEDELSPECVLTLWHPVQVQMLAPVARTLNEVQELVPGHTRDFCRFRQVLTDILP